MFEMTLNYCIKISKYQQLEKITMNYDFKLFILVENIGFWLFSVYNFKMKKMART